MHGTHPSEMPPPSPPFATHPQVCTVEAAREALQQEFDSVQVELESSEAMVGELEQELEEERRKGEEEVGRCEALIVELQGQLEASEEQCRTEKSKVGGASGTVGRGCGKRVGMWGCWDIQGEGQREGKGSCDAMGKREFSLDI